MDFSGQAGWAAGYIIGLVVVLIVVVLVVSILALAWRIGNQAGAILDGLKHAERNTSGLSRLNETIASALAIIAGLKRGRARLGG
jgi:hypothetical protein